MVVYNIWVFDFLITTVIDLIPNLIPRGGLVQYLIPTPFGVNFASAIYSETSGYLFT